MLSNTSRIPMTAVGAGTSRHRKAAAHIVATRPMAPHASTSVMWPCSTALSDHDLAQARAEHGPGVTADRLARTGAQRRADALTEMARRSAAMPPDARARPPLISILCGYETFAGRVCETDDGVVLTPDQVRTLLDETDIERIVFDLPSRVIDVTTAAASSPAASAAPSRSATASAPTPPAATSPASQCHIDHKHPYARGGPTTQANGRLRCPPHDPSNTDDNDEDDDQRGPP